MRIPAGEVLGGSLNGEAGFDWTDGVRWDARIHTSRIDPEPLLPGWPGRLDLDLAIEADDQTNRYEVSLESLQGQLRGVELNGKGERTYRFGKL